MLAFVGLALGAKRKPLAVIGRLMVSLFEHQGGAVENQTPKLAEVDTTQTTQAMKELMAEEKNLDPVYQALVLEAIERR